MDTISVERIAEAVERELARIKAARPSLASRAERAENILVTHLSCRRARVIRVRVSGAAGGARFLVNGSGGAVYVVNPSDWSCSCPDAHRRGKGCKHALACWALERASARPAPASGEATGDLEHVSEVIGRAPTPSCAGCGAVAPSELFEVGEDHLTFFEGDVLCGSCAGDHGVL